VYTLFINVDMRATYVGIDKIFWTENIIKVQVNNLPEQYLELHLNYIT
jgi:hypothetical protein